MSKRRQSKKDRLLRLTQGRCPIHGGGLSQIDVEHVLMPCGHYEVGRAIVKCDRKACDIRAYMSSIDEPAELFPQFEYILNESEG